MMCARANTEVAILPSFLIQQASEMYLKDHFLHSQTPTHSKCNPITILQGEPRHKTVNVGNGVGSLLQAIHTKCSQDVTFICKEMLSVDHILFNFQLIGFFSPPSWLSVGYLRLHFYLIYFFRKLFVSSFFGLISPD